MIDCVSLTMWPAHCTTARELCDEALKPSWMSLKFSQVLRRSARCNMRHMAGALGMIS